MGRAFRSGAALLVTMIVAAVVLQAPVARAAAPTTPPVSATLPVRATNWSDVVTLPRFDPALGELQAVYLEVDARLEGTISVENQRSTPVTDIQARAAAAVTVARPGGAAAASVAPSVTRTHDLAEFDGAVDYAGTSGDRNDVSATGTTTATLTDTADLLLFTGLTPITLPTFGTDVSTPPADVGVTAIIDTRVGATVSVSYSYVTDERPPDPPTIDSSPSAFTADPNPTITFTHEAGATAECQLTSPVSTGPWSTCTSPWHGNLGPTGDGAYTFAVRATDGAGNVGEAATRSFTLDRLAPAAPVVSFSLLGPIPLLGRWSFSIEPGATARCSLDGAAPAPCSSPVTVDLATLLDGDHTLTVVAVDAAGNTGPPASLTHHLDRVAPVPPTFTGHPTSPGNDPTPTWTFDLASDATSATCSVDGAVPVACASPFTANLASAADGPHTLAVRNADSAGNTSGPTTTAYAIDRAPPAAPTVTGPPSPSNDTTPTWTIVAELGATAECRLDGGPWATCAGSFTTTFGPGTDGVHVLTVRSIDTAGNVGPEATSAFTLDTTPPAAPVFLTTPPSPSNNPMPVWTFTVEVGSQPECSLNGGSWTPCSSPYQADLTAAADGVKSLDVRTADAQGNVGPSATDTFTLLRTAPAAPTITSAPPSHGSVATVTFTFTTPPGTTGLCRINSGPRVPCSSPYEVTFATDGTYRFGVQARDAAGNRSAPAEAVYVLDRVAPVAPTFTELPISPSRVTTPRWGFGVEAGSSGECALDGGAWIPCVDFYRADLSMAADGPRTLAVRSIDLAGNVGTPAISVFVLDRTPPNAPVLIGAPAGHTADDTPTWTFTVDADAAAECRLDDGPWLPCDGTFTPDLSGAPDGIHSLEVHAIDAVGNEGPTTVTAFELDRVAAAVASFTVTPVTPGNDTTPEWAFTYEPGTTAWCSLDGGPAAPCDGAFASELLADGSHELTVTVIDAAGNVSQPATSTLELDTVAPEAPSVTAPTTPDRDRSPEWLIELEPGAVAECSLDGAEAVACATVFTADLTGLDGSHELVVIARDAAGNASAPTSSTYVLDTVAPAAPVILHTPDAAAWNWRFSIEAGATAECSVNGVPWATCASPMAGGIPDRTVRFEVRAVDRAGNRSPVTSLTTTPTRGGAVGPPSAPPAAPPPTPHGTAVSGPGALTTPESEPESEPGSPARPPGRTLLPELPIEVDAASILRPMREDGIFAGPVRDLLEAAAETTTIPVLVVMVVLAFVAVQNRIDRQDPKLADAPIRHEPEYLEFD